MEGDGYNNTRQCSEKNSQSARVHPKQCSGDSLVLGIKSRFPSGNLVFEQSLQPELTDNFLGGKYLEGELLDKRSTHFFQAFHNYCVIAGAGEKSTMDRMLAIHVANPGSSPGANMVP